jgi:hypothetical protein
MGEEQFDALLHRLECIEATLALLVQRYTVKDYYDTDEAAKILNRDPFTVRNWCRLGRVRAEKRRSGRGQFRSWVLSHDELLRIQREGLLPAKH